MLLCLNAVASDVRVERVSEGGVQPQIVQGDDGTVHLIYLKGDPARCDVRYATRKPGGASWSQPLTVNSEASSAVAVGTIRGAQLALGPEGSVHVVWNGHGGKDQPAPLFYSRLVGGMNPRFEAQRDLRGASKALDGGASIAANTRGEVYVVWHGAAAEAVEGEEHRVVFVLKSADNGAAFGPASVANLDYGGVCACCSLKAFAAPTGELLTLYRAARKMDQRDVTLLSSRDGGKSFEHRTVGTWAIAACPMSSMSMVALKGGIRGVWESEGRIESTMLDSASKAMVVSSGKGRHPSIAVNAKGETLVAWSVGTGWQKGGELQWRVLDRDGKPLSAQGTAKGIPVWGASAAYADGDSFVVMY